MLAIVREPLVQFFLIGLFVFGAYGVFNSGEVGQGTEPNFSQSIHVDEEQLVQFVKNRFGLFQPGAAENYLNATTPFELQTIVDDFVLEEALLREAIARGLAETDFTVRKRLTSKLDFELRKQGEIQLSVDNLKGNSADQTTISDYLNAEYAGIKDRYDVKLSPALTKRINEPADEG